jgi:hypothetical protein
MNKFIEAAPPRNAEEVLHVNLWWTTHFIGLNLGIGVTQATQLCRKGLSRISDLWNQETGVFPPWPEVRRQFGLLDREQAVHLLMLRHFPPAWRDLLTNPNDTAT